MFFSSSFAIFLNTFFSIFSKISNLVHVNQPVCNSIFTFQYRWMFCIVSVLLMILSINCNFTVCIFDGRHHIKNLTASSYSVPLKTAKTKLEIIPPKDVEGDTF